jgi:hypothetical protein
MRLWYVRRVEDFRLSNSIVHVQGVLSEAADLLAVAARIAELARRTNLSVRRIPAGTRPPGPYQEAVAVPISDRRSRKERFQLCARGVYLRNRRQADQAAGESPKLQQFSP